MTRIFNVPFRFSVPATSSANASSSALYQIRKISEALLVFPVNTGNQLIYRFFDSNNPSVPTTGLPGGQEITLQQTAQGEYVGDGIAYSVPFQYTPVNNPCFLKMYAQNGTSSPLIASAVIALVG